MSNDSAKVTASKIATGATRLYYLDWLRVFAMITIFFFHNSRFFDDNSWHVSNAETSIGAGLFVQFCNPWLMPLFFKHEDIVQIYALVTDKIIPALNDRGRALNEAKNVPETEADTRIRKYLESYKVMYEGLLRLICAPDWTRRRVPSGYFGSRFSKPTFR